MSHNRRKDDVIVTTTEMSFGLSLFCSFYIVPANLLAMAAVATYRSWIHTYLSMQPMVKPPKLWFWFLPMVKCTYINLCAHVCQWVVLRRWFPPVLFIGHHDPNDLSAILTFSLWSRWEILSVSMNRLRYWTRGSVGLACVAHLSFCFEETLYRTFHGASYQISVHLATLFQRRRLFRNRPIRNKNYLC